MKHPLGGIPKVSVGLPVFNGEKYLAEALDSLLKQEYESFELVIFDNASEDATEKICREYVERFKGRMSYFRHASNLGVMANFRYAFESARGEYFMWAACDDLWDERWLLKMVSLIESSNADIAFGRITHIDGVGRSIWQPANNASFCYTGATLLRRLRFFLDYEGLGKANVIYGLFRRRLFPTISAALRDLELGKMRYDYSFVFRLLKEGIVVGDESVVMKKRYRLDSSGEEMGRRMMSENFVKKIVRRVLNPFPEGLLAEYLNLCLPVERVLFVVCLPLKLLIAYRALLQSIICIPRR